MDLTALQYIVTIAEEKKLSRASERLFVTSSALSQCIKKIENELSTPLFEKVDSRTFLLTNAGKIYVDAAKEILRTKDEAYREIQDVYNMKRGKFTFGCSPKRGLAVFSNVFPVFHKEYPNIQIDLVEANLNTLYDMVLDGAIDIATITPLSKELETVGFELLDEEEIVLAIPVGHPHAPLAGKTKIGSIDLPSLNLFKDDAWVLSNKGSMHRNLTDEIFRIAGFSPGKVLLETSSTNPHLIAIEEGIAVGFIPVPRMGKSANIVQFHLKPVQHRRLYAAYRKSYRLSESQRFLIDKIREFYLTPVTKALPPHRLGW